LAVGGDGEEAGVGNAGDKGDVVDGGGDVGVVGLSDEDCSHGGVSVPVVGAHLGSVVGLAGLLPDVGELVVHDLGTLVDRCGAVGGTGTRVGGGAARGDNGVSGNGLSVGEAQDLGGVSRGGDIITIAVVVLV